MNTPGNAPDVATGPAGELGWDVFALQHPVSSGDVACHLIPATCPAKLGLAEISKDSISSNFHTGRKCLVTGQPCSHKPQGLSHHPAWVQGSINQVLKAEHAENGSTNMELRRLVSCDAASASLLSRSDPMERQIKSF